MQWRCLPRRGFTIKETDDSGCGQKGTTSQSLFMEAYGLEVEEAELSTMANSVLGRRGLDWKVAARKKKKRGSKQIQEVQTWKQVRGPAGAVMCETRNMGIKMVVLAHTGL